MSDPSTVRVVRRHGFLALIIAGTCVGLMGAFILLWFKLPVWAPVWVVEHSPWVDPIMRAVEWSGSGGRMVPSVRDPAILRLSARGVSVVPSMVGWLEHGSSEPVQVAASVLGGFKDDRFCSPLVASMRRHAGRSQVDALARLTPSVVVDALLPLPVANDPNTIWMLELAAVVDEPRLVPVLAAIVREPEPPAPQPSFEAGSRWVMAAWALTRSPQPSAIPALLPAFSDRDLVIRRRALEAVWRMFARKLDPRLAEAVRQGLGDADAQVRRYAALTLANGEIMGTEDALLALSRSSDPVERAAALSGLGTSWSSQRAVDRLGECLGDAEKRPHKLAWQGLRRTRRIPSPEITRQAFSMLAVEERKELCRLVSAAGWSRDRAAPAVVALIQAIDDPADEVSALANELLDRIALSETEEQGRQAALEQRRTKKAPVPAAAGAGAPRPD